jgi:hypothetical protein
LQNQAGVLLEFSATETPPMPTLPPAQPPSIDFDLDDLFAAYHIMALMCWPDPEVHNPRLATLGFDALAKSDDDFLSFLLDVKSAIKYNAELPNDALPLIIEDCVRDAAHRALLNDFIKDFVAHHPLKHTRPLTVGQRFWECMRSYKGDIASMHKDLIWQSLLHPVGGYESVVQSPGWDVMKMEIDNCITGHPMFAGLSLYLVATLNVHHNKSSPSPLPCSFNLTYRFIEATFPDSKLSFDYAKAQLPKWHSIAPLWAGLLVVAHRWSSKTFLDIGKLNDSFSI